MTKCFSFGSCGRRGTQKFSLLQQKSEDRRKRETYPFDKVLEYFDFNESLVMETLLIANDLDSNHISSLVISALQNLTERTFSEDVDNLVAVVEVIVRNEEIIASLIVISVVV
jgi:hypothetical protein